MKSKRFFNILMVAALAGGFASCSSDDLAQEGTTTDGGNQAGGMAFTADASTMGSRTSLDLNASPKNFLWEVGDKIWAVDANGAWQNSLNSVDKARQSSFTFKMPGGYNTFDTYTVYYHNNTTQGNKVTIAAAQTQNVANSTAHFGAAGDNGIGEAKWDGTRFRFSLAHKAAYIVFKWRLTNSNNLVSAYVKKIEVTSENNIAGTYDITPAGLINETSGSKVITLALGGYGIPLNSNGSNAAYMVIKPGVHKLKVKYQIQDINTGVVITIAKTIPSRDYKPNDFVPVDGSITLTERPVTQLYYMWDAKKNYWDGHEWYQTSNVWQTTDLRNQTNANYPQNATDDRYYNPAFNTVGAVAHETSGSQNPLFTPTSASHVPNANEMVWYIMKGDPRWDDRAWTAMGHLYYGGIWIKKASVIAAENGKTLEDLKAASPDGVDRRLVQSQKEVTLGTSVPTASEIGNYFYLPAWGYYADGKFVIGSVNYYWSSTGNPNSKDQAYALMFQNKKGNITSPKVTVFIYERKWGLPAVPMQ